MAFAYAVPIADSELNSVGGTTGGDYYTEIDEIGLNATEYASPLTYHNDTDYVFGETAGDDYQVTHEITNLVDTVQDNLIGIQAKLVVAQVQNGENDFNAGGSPASCTFRFGYSDDDGTSWAFGTNPGQQDIASAEYIVLTFDAPEQNISAWNDQYLIGITNMGIDLRLNGSGGSPTNRRTYQLSAVILRLEYTPTGTSRKRFRVSNS